MNEEIIRICAIVTLLAWSVVGGRLWCGKICPVGKLQDVIYKTPLPIKITTFKGDRILRLYKYTDIIIEIIQISFSFIGISYLLEQIVSVFPPLIDRILIIIIFVASFGLRRTFCKYFCMIGAITSLFNKISFYKYKTLKDKCVECGACVKVCKMNIIPYKTNNSPECIRCGLCKKICPQNAIISGFNIKNRNC